MEPNMPKGEMMSEGSDMPPETSMSGNEDCVPVSALAMPDDQEQMTTPEVGDPVTYSTEGTITRIEGDKAYVKRKAVNGQEIKEDAAPVDEMAELESMAKEQPDRYA